MKCAVFRSNKKDLTYLYLADGEKMESVPETLRKLIEPLEQVMELELSPERKLAQENVVEVMKQLDDQGWFLQMPREDNPVHNA